MAANGALKRPVPHVGDQPILWVDVVNDEGVASDPSGGRLIIQEPGASTSTEIPFSSFDVAPNGNTGRVEYAFPAPIATAGLWKFYWEFTAGVVAAEPFSLKVAARTVALP